MAERLRSASLVRDGIVVSGPDAITYLQGQLSQDVAGLEVGGSAWSWLLQPAGKVDALVRVTRTGAESLLVDVDVGWGDAVLARLTRFKLRTRADLTRCGVSVLALRGPGAVAMADEMVADTEHADNTDEAASSETSLVVPFDQPALAVTALWPAAEEAADILARRGTDLSVPAHASVYGMHGDWEVERIAAGVPAMGSELTERTIPAETGLVAITASFTKGCYTGQELVARIDSRGGNVPRHLRVLRSARPLDVGTELSVAGKVVGAVTSSAVSADLGPVALAFVGRAVAPGDTVATVGEPAVEVTVSAVGAGSEAG